jgi:uncharacterized protein
MFLPFSFLSLLVLQHEPHCPSRTMEFPAHLQTTITQQPHPLLFATLSGSHLYGFPSPDSDYDLRGVHILPLNAILGLKEGPETIETTAKEPLDLDLVTHDLKKFLHLLLKRNGYVLEQLFSPLILHTTPAHQELKAIAPRCITRHHSHHYLGFAATQWGLFQKEQPPRIKPLLYIYRVLLTGIHLMETGEIEANLNHLNDRFQLPYLADLIERKITGAETSRLDDTDLAFHCQEYQRLVQALEAASQASHLAEEPSARNDLHDFLIRVRRQEIPSAS